MTERLGSLLCEAIDLADGNNDRPLIITDANALFSIGENHPLLSRLFEAVKNGEQGFAISYVALKETARRWALNQIEARTRFSESAEDKIPHPTALIDQITWKWIQTIETCGGEIIGVEAEHLEEAHRRKREIIPPFRGSDGKQAQNDFRDALIFCAIRDVQKKYDNTVFITGDKRLRSVVSSELRIPLRKDLKKTLLEIFRDEGKVSIRPTNVQTNFEQADLEALEDKYSHPELKPIRPERSHNRFNIENKLNEITADFKEQICYLLAVARLVQPAMVSDTINILKEEPFEYTEDGCHAALDCLTQDGAVRIIGKTMIVEDEDFAEQAIERLGDRVLDLMRVLNG